MCELACVVLGAVVILAALGVFLVASLVLCSVVPPPHSWCLVCCVCLFSLFLCSVVLLCFAWDFLSLVISFSFLWWWFPWVARCGVFCRVAFSCSFAVRGIFVSSLFVVGAFVVSFCCSGWCVCYPFFVCVLLACGKEGGSPSRRSFSLAGGGGAHWRLSGGSIVWLTQLSHRKNKYPHPW